VVCGVGIVQLDGNDPAAPFYHVNRMTADAQNRWRRALIDSDDFHARAAGLLLVSTEWEPDPITGMPARSHDAVLARDELVQLAVGVDDLPVYAMAVRACDQTADTGPRDAACARISLAKWATMDPDNAAPWLQLAASAHARSDPSAVSEAVGQAVHANTVDFYNDALLAYASAGMPRQTNDLERAAFFYGHIGHVGGDGLARSFVTNQYCTAEAIRQSSIRRQCDFLAELFADHGRNTLDLSAAQQLGVRLGWTSERVTAMQQEMLATFRVDPPFGEDPWSCDNVRAINEFASIQGQAGELTAARAAIRKSGKSIPDLAQEQIDSVQKQFDEECSRAGRTVVRSVFGGAIC
jgi:hypothetical protein